jgi:hypothetical protein
MVENRTSYENTYRIRIIGVPNHSIADWLDNIEFVSKDPGETILTGQFADQSALRGLLDQLWNLNYTILSVEKIEKEKPSPEGR